MNPLRAAILSHAAYSPRGTMLKNAERKFNIEGTECFLGVDEYGAYLTFAGTNDWQDVGYDLNAELVDDVFGKVHAGIKEGLDNVWLRLLPRIEDIASDMPLGIYGHSLGGGYANLSAARLVDAGFDDIELITFGSLRTGDTVFADTLDAACYDKHKRFVNNNDVVPRLPPRAMGYNHAGEVQVFTEHGDLRGRQGWLERLFDRIDGRLHDLFELGLDGIKDHSMDNYLKRVIRHFDDSK